jgi:hypothetical protein
MQISSSTTTYDASQTQWTTVPPGPDADGDRQTSPGGDAPAGAPPPLAPGASPGGQFDSATLGGLLALQQQQSTGQAGASQPHHHHHHGHGGHKPTGGESGVAGPTSTDASAPAGPTETAVA